MEGGDALKAKLAELQAMFRDLRNYEGPFDPHFPRTVFHMIFCPPLRCSIDPLEVYGIVQRIFHSKDGRHLTVWFADKPAFRREDATPHDRKAVELLREIRDLALRHHVWVTYVDKKTGSYFPPNSFMAGSLLPAPGDPVVVTFEDYFERLREFDLTDPPTPGDLVPATIDVTILTRAARSGAELADPVPDLCSRCGTRLVEIKAAPPPGLEGLVGSRKCQDCETVYVRPPRDEELTPDQRDERDKRQAVMAEFLRRIEEEFPAPTDAAGAAEAEGGGDVGYLFGSDGEGWKQGPVEP